MTTNLKLIPFTDLKVRFGVTFSRQHLKTLETLGKFPRRVAIGDNRVGWVEAEVEKWMSDKIEARP